MGPETGRQKQCGRSALPANYRSNSEVCVHTSALAPEELHRHDQYPFFKRAKSTSGSDSDEKTAPKKAATKAEAATSSSDDDEEDEADSDTYDKCAHTNCRRPRYDNVNWVQCDVCDDWYHNLCILGAEKAVVEDEFHCGCAKNGKRKPTRAQRPKKRQAV